MQQQAAKCRSFKYDNTLYKFNTGLPVPRERGIRIVRVPRLQCGANELVRGNPSPQVSCAMRFRFADCLDDGYDRSVCPEFSTSAALCLFGGQRGSSRDGDSFEGKGVHVQWVETAGAPGWLVWRQNPVGLLAQLFQKK